MQAAVPPVSTRSIDWIGAGEGLAAQPWHGKEQHPGLTPGRRSYFRPHIFQSRLHLRVELALDGEVDVVSFSPAC